MRSRSAISAQAIAKVHEISGHPCIKGTLYFCPRLNPDQHYLTLIDCSPTRYALWRKFRRQDTNIVLGQLESLFFEQGVLKQLLIDKGTSLRSSVFREFAIRWGMAVRYHCDNVPSGNGISERYYRMVKSIVARKGCSVMKVVYPYNVMPRGNDGRSAFANQIFR